MPSHMPYIVPERSQSCISIICEKCNWFERYRVDMLKKEKKKPKEENTVFNDVLIIDYYWGKIIFTGN